jgi:D-arabinose 1-dehydrogenase-like Zn-dependent alcohol dehydrogenase
VFENGRAGTIAHSLECVARGAIVAVIGFLAKADDMPDVAGAALAKGCIVRGVNVGGKPLTEDIVAFVTAKDLNVPVEKEFGFSQQEVLEAYKYLESGGHVGKVAIRFQ